MTLLFFHPSPLPSALLFPQTQKFNQARSEGGKKFFCSPPPPLQPFKLCFSRAVQCASPIPWQRDSFPHLRLAPPLKTSERTLGRGKWAEPLCPPRLRKTGIHLLQMCKEVQNPPFLCTPFQCISSDELCETKGLSRLENECNRPPKGPGPMDTLSRRCITMQFCSTSAE